MLAYSAIKSKFTLGLGNNFTMEYLSNELNKPVINKFPRKKIIVNYIDEIHSCDLIDMVKYSIMNKGYKYIFTNKAKYAWSFPIKSKKISDLLKEENYLIKHLIILNGLKNYLKFIL